MPKKKSRPKRNLPPAHTGRPVRGCECKWCVRHRKLAAQVQRNRNQLAAVGVLGRAVIAGLEQQDRRDRALEALYEYNEIGTVRAGEKATRALRDVVDER